MTAPLISGFTTMQIGITADANPVLADAIPDLRAGELAIYYVAQTGTGGSPATPTGWTAIIAGNRSNSIGTTGSARFFGRIADGTSTDRPSFAIGASSRSYYIQGLRIRAHGVTNVGTDIPVANTASVGNTGNTPTYDPAAVTSPNGGAKDYLSLVGILAGGNVTTVTLTPSTSYTAIGGVSNLTNFNFAMVQYRRLSNASSEDPGVIAYSGTAVSRPYAAYTILIPPYTSGTLTMIHDSGSWVRPTQNKRVSGAWDAQDVAIKVRSGGAWV